MIWPAVCSLPHGVRVLALTVLLLGGACATDGEDAADEGPTVISKVVLMDIPIAPGPMLSIGYPCFAVEIPASQDCSISIVEELGATDGVETVLPACALEPGQPCWKISIDAQNCFEAAHQRLEIVRTTPLAYAHHVLAQCVSL